jgi:hypothetical protein
MPAPTPATSPTRAGSLVAAERLPPEERFWKRHSPHHEFPLSSATSMGLHALILFLLIVAGWVAYKLGIGAETRPAEVTPVVIDSGGGRRTGVEGKTGDGGAPLPEAVENPVEPPKPPSAENVKAPEVGPPDGLHFRPKDNTTGRPVQIGGDKLGQLLQGLDEMAHVKLGNDGPAAPGNGPGKTGGPGGPGDRPGKKATKREARVLRWSMNFSTQNGDDYLRQLKDIRPGSGAILAVPTNDGQFEVLRDLSQRPAAGKVEDLKDMKRIFWMDDKPDSVAGLARALGIKAPPYFVAFFPSELEDELVRLEREKTNGAREEDIEETRFEVVRADTGYKPRVVSVRVKK